MSIEQKPLDIPDVDDIPAFMLLGRNLERVAVHHDNVVLDRYRTQDMEEVNALYRRRNEIYRITEPLAEELRHIEERLRVLEVAMKKVRENERLGLELAEIHHRLSSMVTEFIDDEAIDFDVCFDKRSVPKKSCGVYLLFTERGLEYIGQSQCIKSRLMGHNWFKRRPGAIAYILEENKRERLEIERRLIQKMEPIRNVSYNGSG